MANRTPTKKTDQIEGLIPKLRGNVSAIARKLQITRGTLNNIVNANESLKTLLADERERMVDDAEEGLGKAILSGEGWAVCFALKTQGQSRGYIEKQRHELTGSDGKDLIPISYEVVIIDGTDANTDQGQD